MDGINLSLTFSWTRAGSITLVDGRLAFPDVPAKPAVYALQCRHKVDREPLSVYVGETVNLRRRLHQNYRYPGAQQATNVWVNDWLIDLLIKRNFYDVLVLEQIRCTIAGREWPINLRDAYTRHLLEAAAIQSFRDREITVMNKRTDTFYDAGDQGDVDALLVDARDYGNCGFGIVIQKAKGRRLYFAYVPELQDGLGAQVHEAATTLKAVKRSICRAITLHLEHLQAEGEPIPSPQSLGGYTRGEDVDLKELAKQAGDNTDCQERITAEHNITKLGEQETP